MCTTSSATRASAPTKIRSAASRHDGSVIAELPLFRRYPPLAALPRAALGNYPTPLLPLAAVAPDLWIKRDDLCADPLGGNKVRALEFLLAPAPTRVVTIGSEGSTHALAVATYARALGARVDIGRWRQVMNPSAERVAARLRALASAACAACALRSFRTPAGAYLWAWRRRLAGARWIAAGGSTPLGVLGHVNAALELCDQLDAMRVPAPGCVVVPLGTGGTAAGLALGFAIAKRPIRIVAVRVVPRIIGRRRHVMRLAGAAARLIERTANVTVPRPRREMIDVVHDAYGGAYGRETDAGRTASERLALATGISLDATYSAKAFAVALEHAAGEPTLFWLTFDSRSTSPP
jgi:D-cysteine desulfhydrase